MAGEVQLQIISEKTLHQTVVPGLLAYSPSMELVALGSADNSVLIYRLNGQRVHLATQKSIRLQVNKIQWKPNGQLLAIAWSDGVVRLVGAESSKTVHQISTTAGESQDITCVGWVSNLIKRKSSRAFPKGPKSWRQLLESEEASEEQESSLDLPRDLALIDIESSLPHLSTLPAGVTADDVFSSRASLDGIFRPFDPKNNEKVDIMIVGTTDGRVHVSIYDSFVLGFFPPPIPSSRATTHQLVLHASHRQYSTHGLLMKSASTLVRGLHFVPMDLRFVSASSEHLSVLASRATTLQNLLRYIYQVQELMVTEWQNTQDLPSRFLRNINETLAELHNCDIVTAMYHSVVTGDTFPSVREWLVDELAERGHKRWDKAVTMGLDALRRLVHEHMLPALERCGLILSRLLGIARFQAVEDSTGFSSRQISLVMNTVACLNLVSMRILMFVVEEIELFTAFSLWLRFEIDRLASDSSASPSDEQAEKEAAIDPAKVLQYIQTCLTSNRLAAFFREESSEEKSENDNSEASHKGLPLFDLVDAQLKKHDRGEKYDQSLTSVKKLYETLDRQAEVVFQGIAEAEKRNVLFGEPVSLGVEGDVGAVAMRICPEDESHCSSYIAAAENHIIHLYHVLLRINNGVSTRLSTSTTSITLGPSNDQNAITDLGFLDDSTLLVLSNTPGTEADTDTTTTNIEGIPYRSSTALTNRHHATNAETLDYTSFTSSKHPPKSQPQDISHLSKHYDYLDSSATFTSTNTSLDPFIPTKMEIQNCRLLRKNGSGNNSVGDGSIDSASVGLVDAYPSTRIVLLDSEKARYRVLRLVSKADDDGNGRMSVIREAGDGEEGGEVDEYLEQEEEEEDVSMS